MLNMMDHVSEEEFHFEGLDSDSYSATISSMEASSRHRHHMTPEGWG